MNLNQVKKHFQLTTHAEVGALVGVSQPAVSNWYSRGYIPELQQRRIADLSGGVLKVTKRPKQRT